MKDFNPLKYVWLVEASSATCKAQPRYGSAVLVRLKGSDSAKNYLLTCQHVVRSDDSNGKAGYGPVLDVLTVWEPSKGYSRREDATAASTEIHPHGISDAEWPPSLRQPSNDWVLLEVKDPDFQQIPDVVTWGRQAHPPLTIVGYPGGPIDWRVRDIVEATPSRDYELKTSRTRGVLYLTGPAQTRNGMSGGGVFDSHGQFVGLHRESSHAALEYRSIEAANIRFQLENLPTHFGVDLQPHSPDVPAPTENTLVGKRCLLVFIHGLYGDSVKTWAQLREVLDPQLPPECGTMSISYPAKLYQDTSLQKAAEIVATNLSETAQEFDHYIFVCHSAGGIALKKCFLGESVQQKEDPERNQKISAVLSKTRAIINIGVPHKGSSENYSSLFSSSYKIFWKLSGWFIKWLPKSWNAGKNEMIEELSHNSSNLLSTDVKFRGLLESAATEGLPTPTIRNFVGIDDTIIHHDKDRMLLYVNAGHSGGKDIGEGVTVQLTVPDAVVRAIDVALSVKTHIANTQMNYCNELAELDGVRSLLGSANVKLSQTTVGSALLRLTTSPFRGPKSYAIIGPPGVGKSTVLRFFIARICAATLTWPEGDAPTVLYIPLRDMSLDFSYVQLLTRSETRDEGWDRIIESWCEWIEGLSEPLADSTDSSEFRPPSDEVQRMLRRGKSVVVLDGVDEFLLQHRVQPRAFEQLARHIEERYQSNSQLSIIYGVRDTIPSAARLATSNNHVFPIGVLDDDGVRELCPAAVRVLSIVSDSSTQQMLRTPMYLPLLKDWLETETKELSDEEIELKFNRTYHNRTAMLTIACNSLLESRRTLTRLNDASEDTLTRDALLDAISLVGRSLYDDLQGDNDARLFEGKTALDIVGSIHELAPRWLTSQLTNSDRFKDISSALKSLENVENLNLLLQNSLFFPVGRGRFRFRHDHWQTYFLARYFAVAFELTNVAEFEYLAIPPEVVYTIGNLLDANVLMARASNVLDDLSQIHNVLSLVFSKINPERSLFTSGNLTAVVCGNERDRVIPGVAEVIFENLDRMHPFSQCVAVNAMAHTGVDNGKDPAHSKEARDILIPLLNRVFESDNLSPIPKSLCESYLHEFGVVTSHDSTTALVSDPSLRQIAGREYQCNGKVGVAAELNPKQLRSLQRSTLGLINTLWLTDRVKSRVIASVHYFAYLACASELGMSLCSDVEDAIVELAEPHSKYMTDANAVMTTESLRNLLIWVSNQILSIREAN